VSKAYPLPRISLRIATLAAPFVALALAACGPATLPPGDTIADPGEAQNRAIHDFNLALDRAMVAPVATAYGSTVPEPVRDGVSNFASNLNQPGYILNDLLQLQFEDAIANTFRFALNSTVGLGGLLDPATAIGMTAREADFGETMHVYGIPEGDFVMLPVVGPSTTRDTVGLLVDIATNPVRHVVEAPQSRVTSGSNVADRLNSRYELSGTIDSLFYDSADSYSALRSLYLQNRRFELRGTDLSFDATLADTAGAAAADPSTDPYYDPYNDPYFDPYAQ